MIHPSILPVVLCLAVCMFAGCASDANPMGSVQPARPLTGTYWRLTALEGSPAAHAGGRESHIVFREDGFGAVGGVNQMSGMYERMGNSIKLTPGPMTRMAGPPELMQQENRFVELLGKVNGYRISADRLTLSEGGTPLLEFAAAIQP